MDFEQRKRVSGNEENYHIENMRIAREFSKGLIKEMKELVRSVVIFGSNTNDTLKKDSDIDLMIVLDNVSVFVSAELREAYKIIVGKLNQEVANDKIHLMTVNLSDLWDMARKGDPVVINVLRYGSPLFDRDLIEPLQYLLEIGRIKPTRESVRNYMARSETLLEETNRHLMEAMLDLYYSLVDMVHASLMVQKVLPPSPKDMPKIFKSTFKKTPLEKYGADIEELYNIAKEIEHRKYHEIRGSEYDRYHKRVSTIIKDLKAHNEKEIKRKDPFEF